MATQETSGAPVQAVEKDDNGVAWEYWSQKYADGRIETQRRRVAVGQSPGEWEKLPDRRDPDLEALHKQDVAAAKPAASANESVPAPKDQPKVGSRTPTGDIQWTDNPNFQKPETVTRNAAPTPGTDAALDDPRSVTAERVTKTQADYDRQVAQDQRQAQQDLQQRAEAAEQAAIARGRQSIEQQRLTADQAHQRVADDLARIHAEIAREQNAIAERGHALAAETARRGQDLQVQSSREGNQVTLRGQDVSAGVSQRGQDLGYEQSLVGDTVKMADTIASHSAPLWQIAQVDATTHGKWGADVPPMQNTAPLFGTDPAAFVGRAADEARKRRPERYVLPGADQYKLPPA